MFNITDDCANHPNAPWNEVEVYHCLECGEQITEDDGDACDECYEERKENDDD